MNTQTPLDLRQFQQHLTIFFDVFNLEKDAWPKNRLSQLENTVRAYKQTPRWQFIKRASLKRRLVAQKNNLFESLWLFQQAKIGIPMQMKAMVRELLFGQADLTLKTKLQSIAELLSDHTVIPKIDAAYLNHVIHLDDAARLLQERRIFRGVENYLKPKSTQSKKSFKPWHEPSKTNSLYLGQTSQQKNQNTLKKPTWNLEQALNAFLFIQNYGRKRRQQRLNTLCKNMNLHPIFRKTQSVLLNDQTLILPDRMLERFTLKNPSRFLKGGWLLFTWPWALAKKSQSHDAQKKYLLTKLKYRQFATQLFLKLVAHTHDLNAFDTQAKTICQGDVMQPIRHIALDYNVYQSLKELKTLKILFEAMFAGLKIMSSNKNQQTSSKTKRKSVLSRFFGMFKKESETQRFKKESTIMVRTETLETANYLLKTYEQAVKFKMREFGIWLKTHPNADMLTLPNMQALFKGYMAILETCEPVHTAFDEVIHAHNLQLPIPLQHRFSLEMQDFKEAKIRLTLKLEGLLYGWKSRKMAAEQLAKKQAIQKEKMKQKALVIKPVK